MALMTARALGKGDFFTFRTAGNRAFKKGTMFFILQATNDRSTNSRVVTFLDLNHKIKCVSLAYDYEVTVFIRGWI